MFAPFADRGETGPEMSSENLELIRSGYSDPYPLSAFSARIVPDVEFDFTDVYPDRPVLRGIAAVRQFRETGPWDSLEFEPERYIDVDDNRVLVFVRMTATGKGSGAPVEMDAAHEFTFRDGLVVRFKVYGDRTRALEAVGLEE